MLYHTRQRAARGSRCHWPGCGAEARYPAPSAPDRLQDYLWFCLEHVRIYNREWSYLPEADQFEIDRAVRESLEPARRTRGPDFRAAPEFEGPFCEPERGPASRRWPPGSPEARAAATLALGDDATLPALKSRYKELAKNHHPDANGGCPASGERMKSITLAYRVLHQALSAPPAR